MQASRTLVVRIAIALLVIGGIVFVIADRAAAPTSPTSDVGTGGGEGIVSTDGTTTVPTTEGSSDAGSDRGTQSAPTSTIDPASGSSESPLVSIDFPYRKVVYSFPYQIGWRADAGTTATVALVKNGSVVADIPDCTNMPVRPGMTAYCSWSQEALGQALGTIGFSLRLRVINKDQTVYRTVPVGTFAFAPRSSVLWVPHKDTVWGWSVRTPEEWTSRTTGFQTVFAERAADVTQPLSAREAFVVEYCSVAREGCATRVEAYTMASGVHSATLGGKNTKSRTYAHAGGFVREDMLQRGGVAYFISRKVEDTSGEAFSPFVRGSLDQFDLIPSGTTATAYTLDAPFRAGMMLLESVDNQITFVRLYAGAQGCSIDTSSGAIIDGTSHSWSFKKSACEIKGRLEAKTATYMITEDECEAYRTKECSFAGRYVAE